MYSHRLLFLQRANFTYTQITVAKINHFTVAKVLVRRSKHFRQTTIGLRADSLATAVCPGCHHLYSVLSPAYQRWSDNFGS